MALQVHSRQIGEHTYNVTTLDAIKGRKTFVRLANCIGTAFKDLKSEADFVANLLMKSVNSTDLDHFCDVFGATTTVTGGEYEERAPNLIGKVFMEHFAGKYLELTEWLAFCVEVNFGNFLADLPGLKERLAAQFGLVAETKKED